MSYIERVKQFPAVRRLRRWSRREPAEQSLAELTQSVRELNERLMLEADVGRLSEFKMAQDRWREAPSRDQRVENLLTRAVQGAGLTEGDALEIGGRENPRTDVLAGLGLTYTALDLRPGDGVLVGDITDCPEIPEESFDVVFSHDVFEHLNRPWKAASEIVRMLRPGGLAVTSTLFSWRYHPVPIDYWRFTPDGLSFLFEELETLEAGWDDVERRRDIDGKGRAGAIERDEFGGWRENWRVFHVGQKPRAA